MEDVGGISFSVDTNGAEQKLEDVAKAFDKVDAASVKAGERLRDAKGRFVSIGDSAQATIAPVRNATEAFAQYAAAGMRASSTSATIAAANDKVTKSSLNTGRAMLETGRVIQDFAQGGIGGVLNNVEGFASALGLGSGVAGAATAAGVAFYLLKPYVASAMESLRPEPVRSLADEFGHLTEKVEKLKTAAADDPFARVEMNAARADLERLTKAQEAYAEARAGKPKAVKESESAVKSAIDESPGALQALKNLIGPQVEAADPTLAAKRKEIAGTQSKLDEYKAQGASQLTIREYEAVLQRQKIEASGIQSKLYAPGPKGEPSVVEGKVGEMLRGDPNNLAGTLDKLGQKDAARRVREATPEGLERKALDKQLAAEQEELQKSRDEAARDEKDRAAKAVAAAKKDKADLKRAMAEVKRIGDETVAQMEADERAEAKEAKLAKKAGKRPRGSVDAGSVLGSAAAPSGVARKPRRPAPEMWRVESRMPDLEANFRRDEAINAPDHDDERQAAAIKAGREGEAQRNLINSARRDAILQGAGPRGPAVPNGTASGLGKKEDGEQVKLLRDIKVSLDEQTREQRQYKSMVDRQYNMDRSGF